MYQNKYFEEEINKELDEGLEISKLINDNITIQEKQLINVDDSLGKINYYNNQGKRILKRMSNLIYRIFNKSNNSDKKNINNNSISTENYKIENDNQEIKNDIESKIILLKKNAINTGISLEKQNTLLDSIDLKIYNNNVKINKNIEDVNNLLLK